MYKDLRIPEELSTNIYDLINNTEIGGLIKVSSHESEPSNYILITNSCDEVRMMYSHQTRQKIKLIDEILHLFISSGDLESVGVNKDGEINMKKIFKSEKHLVHQDYLLDVMNSNNLDHKTTLFVDLINDCNYWKDKYSHLEYMPFSDNLNDDGSINFDNLEVFMANVIDKINKENYKTIIIDKIWIITQFSNIWVNKGNDLFEKLNELCNNSGLKILISYERFGPFHDFDGLYLYPNLEKLVNITSERDTVAPNKTKNSEK